jgi:TolA-binding protein
MSCCISLCFSLPAALGAGADGRIARAADITLSYAAPSARGASADVSRTSATALLRSARQDFDSRRFPAASATLEELLERKLPPAQTADVMVLLCESKLREGKFAEAESLAVQARGKVSDESALERLSFLKAEILYFSGDTKGATDEYIVFLEDNPESRLVNDAIERLLLIDENLGSSPAALAAYARAELAQSAGIPDSALAIIDTILRDSPEALIADEALEKKGDILREERKFADAMNQYRLVEVRFPQSRLVPASKLKIAELYAAELGEKDKAIAECEEIATKFPGTSYAVEARSILSKLGKGPGKAGK